MKTKLFQLMLTCVFIAGSTVATLAQSFCVIDDFGEPYHMTATNNGDGTWSLSGTACITGDPNNCWPATGSFTGATGIMLIDATNPSPSGCIYFVDGVDFRWKYTCGRGGTVCSMDGGYQQICFGGVISQFSLGATVYKDASACGAPNLNIGGSSALKNGAANQIVNVAQGNSIYDILGINEISVNPSVIVDNASISLNLNTSGQVSLGVYSMQGQQIKSLANQNLQAGNYNFTWNGTDNNGKQVQSGLYMVTLKTGNLVRTVMVSKN